MMNISSFPAHVADCCLALFYSLLYISGPGLQCCHKFKSESAAASFGCAADGDREKWMKAIFLAPLHQLVRTCPSIPILNDTCLDKEKKVLNIQGNMK